MRYCDRIQAKEDSAFFNERVNPNKKDTVQGTSAHAHNVERTAHFSSVELSPQQTSSPRDKMSSRAEQTIPLEQFGDPNKDVGDFVESRMQDPAFFSSYASVKKNAPLPVLAAAKMVTDVLLPRKASVANADKFEKYYKCFPKHQLCWTLPKLGDDTLCDKPHFHSITGTKIYNLRWELQFPELDLKCGKVGCTGRLHYDRNDFSKNKKLFPIFHLTEMPSWCIVPSYLCENCGQRTHANNAKFLSSLPPHVRHAYPVEAKYASTNQTFHLHRDLTLMMEEMMLTYANGDHLFRCMYRSMNKNYIRRLTNYLSKWKSMVEMFPETYGQRSPPKYPKKHQGFIRFYPPAGSALRDAFLVASQCALTCLGVSDESRHTREIQAVVTKNFIAQDHTNEAVKNYYNNQDMHAIWDVMTDTGEIACAVIVKDTSVGQIAHAVEQLKKRPGFDPVAMYCDTWPNKKEFWLRLLGPHLEGKLGLFHYIQRIVKTLRKPHPQRLQALTDLRMCIYAYEPTDLSNVIRCLNDGTLGGKKHHSAEIEQMRRTGEFHNRFQKYLRKVILDPVTILHNLDLWWDKYKVTSSDPVNRPARGMRDPASGLGLFTEQSKATVARCKERAKELQDPRPVTDLYREIKASPLSKNKLSVWCSLRGESRLESFHDPLAHFGNGGMRHELADNLNLMGTARHNVRVRHMLKRANEDPACRAEMPLYVATEPSYFDHTKLTFANGLARATGYGEIPFPDARDLPDDTGERFFAKYYNGQTDRNREYRVLPDSDMCTCYMCANGKYLGNVARNDVTCNAVVAHKAQLTSARDQSKNTLTGGNFTEPLPGTSVCAGVPNSGSQSNRDCVEILPKMRPMILDQCIPLANSNYTPVINQMSLAMMGHSSFPTSTPTHVVADDGSGLLLNHPWPPRYVNHRSRERPKCNCPVFEQWFLVTRHLNKHPGRPPHAENCRLHPRNVRKQANNIDNCEGERKDNDK